MLLTIIPRRKAILISRCFFIFAILSLLTAAEARNCVAETKFTDFAYTHAPLESQDVEEASAWSRVVIMEMYNPTFEGRKLNISNAALVSEWAELYDKMADRDANIKIGAVNKFFNRIKIVPKTKSAVNNNWGTPREFLEGENVGSGNYAIAKYFALLALGVKESDLSLMVVYDKNAGTEHILLVTLLNNTFYLLDNRHDKMQAKQALDCYSIKYFANRYVSWQPYGGYDKDGSRYSEGKPFHIYRPTSAKKQELNIPEWDVYWNRVCEQERDKPTFRGDRLNVGNQRLAADWTELYALAVEGDLYAKMEYVNKFCNRKRYVEDEVNWSRTDYWTTPHEFFEYGGDCEDYAIAKYYALKALGVPAGSMHLVWVLENSGEGHMVLAVSDFNAFYVLDNDSWSNTIYRNGGAVTYTPIYYLNESGAWWPKK